MSNRDRRTAMVIEINAFDFRSVSKKIQNGENLFWIFSTARSTQNERSEMFEDATPIWNRKEATLSADLSTRFLPVQVQSRDVGPHHQQTKNLLELGEGGPLLRGGPVSIPSPHSIGQEDRSDWRWHFWDVCHKLSS